MRASAARRRACARVRAAALTLACVVAAAGSTAAEGRLSTPEEAYEARGVPRVVFDGRQTRMEPAEARFLEALFALTDEAVVENANLLRWFASDGRAGLHFLDARERLAAIRARLAALEPPARLGPVRSLVLAALGHQRSFFAQHYDAVQTGRPFRSQLTDEFAWHDGPQRAREALLRAYAELRGLYPEADAGTRAALNAHLRALDLGP